MSSEVTEKLRLRHEARLAALEEQRLEKEKITVEEHTTTYFIEEFSKKRTSIEEMLSSAAEVPRDQLQQHFHQIANEVQALQKYLTDSTLFLTAYEVRTSQQLIAQLQQNFLSQRDQLQPKKKFAFKSRKRIVPAGGGKATSSDNVGNGKSGGSEKMSAPLTSAVDIRDKTGEDIELKDDAVRGQDVALCNLSNCVVKIYGVPGTVHCSNARDCRFLFGPIYRSVFVDDCSDCNFNVACQQLRVHSTHLCVFSLHITSHPIIEDCTGLQFSTYNWQYPEYEAHFTDAGLSHEVNSWDKIDDFNWLSSKEPSPNWSLLSKSSKHS